MLSASHFCLLAMLLPIWLSISALEMPVRGFLGFLLSYDVIILASFLQKLCSVIGEAQQANIFDTMISGSGGDENPNMDIHDSNGEVIEFQ